MKILLIGNGGREHALAWKLVQSERVAQLYVAPGNSGTMGLPKTTNIPLSAASSDEASLAALRDFALEQAIDLTIVGPEAPLVAGVTDLFTAAGLKVFGPSKAAAQLEGSKAFSKQFMQQHHIPTGQAEVFSDFDEAVRYLRGLDDAPVIKASGLAAGKGVILPSTKETAAAVLQIMLLERRFGEASDTVLIEEQLQGPELSVLAFCDGEHISIMPPAQDHKRAYNRDRGPNTGGMGAFSPSPLATPELLAEVEETILQPTLAGMAAAGTPYVGILYAGLMLTESGIKVLEFNCRFGDPEAQVIVPLLDGDLAEICLACVEGRLDQIEVGWREQAAVTVVMASAGYPDQYETGVEITHIDAAEQEGCLVFHAGAKWVDGRLLTDGGRVLAVTGLGGSIQAAADSAYAGVRKIHFNEAHYRRDIARPR
ncbi:MAG: phosphoribosylamine--glycine ligase [Caldilineaceae bacterium]|nr:phosphoribosylamine--glycine ligase [Caldilineaceae bacterium]